MAGIDKLIINSAYHEPTSHWRYNLETQQFERTQGRRPAGYVVAGQERNVTTTKAALSSSHS